MEAPFCIRVSNTQSFSCSSSMVLSYIIPKRRSMPWIASGEPSSRSDCSAFMRSGDCAYLLTARLTFLTRALCSRPSLENRLNTPIALYRAGVYTCPPGGSTAKWPSGNDVADALDQPVEAQRLAQTVEI